MNLIVFWRAKKYNIFYNFCKNFEFFFVRINYLWRFKDKGICIRFINWGIVLFYHNKIHFYWSDLLKVIENALFLFKKADFKFVESFCKLSDF